MRKEQEEIERLLNDGVSREEIKRAIQVRTDDYRRRAVKMNEWGAEVGWYVEGFDEDFSIDYFYSSLGHKITIEGIEHYLNIKKESNDIPKKGAFIFDQHKNMGKENISIFIYAKCTQGLLKEELPLENNEIDNNHNFLMIINFDFDFYKKSGTEEDVKEIIDKDEVIDLLNNSYETIKQMGLPFLEENYYNGVLEYATKMLENIEKAEISLLQRNPQ